MNTRSFMKMKFDLKQNLIEDLQKLKELLQENDQNVLDLYYIAVKVYDPDTKEESEFISSSTTDIRELLATLEISKQKMINQVLEEENPKTIRKPLKSTDKSDIINLLTNIKAPSNSKLN